jgi:hypothetical protein
MPELPLKEQCPCCAEIVDVSPIVGDYREYNCPNDGIYRITNSAKAEGEHKSVLEWKTALADAKNRSPDTPTITSAAWQ